MLTKQQKSWSCVASIPGKSLYQVSHQISCWLYGIKDPAPKYFFFLPSSLSPGMQGLFWVVAWVAVTLYQGILCFWQVPIMLWTSALKALNQADNSFYINQTTTIFNNFPSSWDWICTSDLCIRDITNPQRHSEPWLCSVFPQKLLHLHEKATASSTMQEDADNSILVTCCQAQLATINSRQTGRGFLGPGLLFANPVCWSSNQCGSVNLQGNTLVFTAV